MKRGFTLIELMVSIAIALLLIVGVNAVFRIASTSVGAGQALSVNANENRSVQTVLYTDFAQSVIRSGDSPCFVMRSSRTSAFLDREDELSDQDYAAAAGGTSGSNVDAAIRTVDIDGNNIEGEAGVTGEIIPRNNLTQRNHRQDVMCFFARHLYPRQTGNDGTYVADQTSNEAYIWYGHLRQPGGNLNDPATNENPGWQQVSGSNTKTSVTNPNNFYARQWVLGRVAILLAEPEPDGTIRDKARFAQFYIRRSTTAVDRSTGPLSADSTAFNGAAAQGGVLLTHSRYDLAATSIDGFRDLLRNTVLVQPSPNFWYGDENLTPRFAGYPFPLKPMSSFGVARTTPVLVQGCTSFIVEYAGDFLKQDENTGGTVLNNYNDPAEGTDGQTDYFIDVNGIRRTFWYGYPRDINGNGIIAAAEGDVVPFRDFNGGMLAPFEHTVGPMPVGNYTNPALDAEYTAAWQPPGTYVLTAPNTEEPPRPTMVRVTMTIDDPQGRLTGGQTYEYVIELP